MDCLHGILMHNDEQMGEDHKAEDQYLKFKGMLETEKPKQGPFDAEMEFHGALMHGDDVAGQKHEEHGQALPEIKIQKGPKDLNDAMHELMHGKEGVKKHTWDKDGKEGVPGPPDEKQLMHGLLMHGDVAHGDHEYTEDSEVVNTAPVGPMDAAEQMHGVLLHGDKEQGHHHEHKADEQEENSEVTNTEPIGPMDAAEQMHGILMHGDQEQGHHHEHKGDDNSDDSGGPVGPDHDSLHGVLMHGDSEPGHDHTEDHENAVNEVVNDLSKILELELDEDLLRIADIRSLLAKDQAEYNNWKTENPEHENEPVMGSTYASVSDSIISDIEMMKKRYLSKLTEDLNTLERDDIDVDVKNDEIPFTAEDANAVLDHGSEAGEHEDMRHDVELVGSTDPINSRHKMFQTLHEAKEKK